jgi:hypothetical protein
MDLKFIPHISCDHLKDDDVESMWSIARLTAVKQAFLEVLKDEEKKVCEERQKSIRSS